MHVMVCHFIIYFSEKAVTLLVWLKLLDLSFEEKKFLDIVNDNFGLICG